jgi:hypothetical protein
MARRVSGFAPDAQGVGERRDLHVFEPPTARKNEPLL